uniref:TCF3 fusion partner n=1 Tax=Coturnix japonica TaxID=93934 RepID=A0A8C2SS25_COTJA
MAAVGFEEFSAPPGSELALPPLFGGHILEGELEAEVEFEAGGGPGGPGGGGDEEEEEEEQRREEGRRREEMARRKMAALGRRCRELEQVPNEGIGFLWGQLPAEPPHLPARRWTPPFNAPPILSPPLLKPPP